MRFTRKCSFVIIALLSIVSLVSAQDSCPADVGDAIALLNDNCFDIGRNQACYGNGDIVAVPVSTASIDFSIPGDSATVDDIASLTLSPFESDFTDWGVAVLILQANLPDTLPGQNVTMLLLGDTSFSNDNDAYYFTSGIGSPTCNQAPDGMLIQTPDGVGQVTITLNGIDIALGSTAYLGTLEENVLTFALLEGNASLSVEDSMIDLESEQFTTIELDEDGNATGEFSEVEDIEELDLPELPLVLLPESITEDSETVAVSDELIVPQSGNWMYTISSIEFGEGCPSFLNEAAIREGMNSFGYGDGTIQEFTIEQEVDIENFFNLSEVADAGLNYTYDNSTVNVYTIVLDLGEGSSVTYTWRVLSDTQIEGEVSQLLSIPDLAECIISTSLLIEHQS